MLDYRQERRRCPDVRRIPRSLVNVSIKPYADDAVIGADSWLIGEELRF